MKVSNHKFAVGDTVRYPVTRISGDGSRSHHFQWADGKVEALGWSKPRYKDIETGEVDEGVNQYGIAYRKKLTQIIKAQTPLYRINEKWYGWVKAA